MENSMTMVPHTPSVVSSFHIGSRSQVLDWALNQTHNPSPPAPISRANFDLGFGIAGHSMGGQATLFSSSLQNATAYNIRTAVFHHAYTHVFPAPTVPFIVFTGEKDTTAPPEPMGIGIFNSTDNYSTDNYSTDNYSTDNYPTDNNISKFYVDSATASHHEPDVFDYNDLLPQFTAAWFKL